MNTLIVGISILVIGAAIFSADPVTLAIIILVVIILATISLILVARSESAKGQLKDEAKSLNYRNKPGPKNIFYIFRKSTWEVPVDRSNRNFMNNDIDLNDGHIGHDH